MYWTEQQKYMAMWAHEEYRRVAPGAQVAPEFLNVACPHNGAHIIDFGAGTGKGSLMIAVLANTAGIDVHIDMLDFAANSLDADVADLAHRSASPTTLTFTQHDLTKPIELRAPYGFCTDVMEHIPPADVDIVLIHILQAAQHVFFQISCVDDSCGVLIGHALHLSVHPPAWWKTKLEQLGCTLHYWRENDEACVAYVTAWSNGQDIVDVGKINVAEELIRTNVRHNVKAGWHQVKPHARQPTEVMILGGGPSLRHELDTIRRMRFEGAKLVTLNGAYNWAIQQELDISAQIIVDARPFNWRFTVPVMPKVIYLIGSQCDPRVLQELPKERTLLWHTTAEIIRDILEEECPGEWFGVPGGSTVLLRAIPLLRMLGYHRFHLFGCDSCVRDGSGNTHIKLADSYLHHAYPQPENNDAAIYPVTLGSRMFACTGWQIAQGQEFINLIRVIGNMFEIQVHGGGLLSWIIEYSAHFDEEERQAALKFKVGEANTL